MMSVETSAIAADAADAKPGRYRIYSFLVKTDRQLSYVAGSRHSGASQRAITRLACQTGAAVRSGPEPCRGCCGGKPRGARKSAFPQEPASRLGCRGCAQ